MKNIRVLIADDHAVVREGLVHVLSRQEGIEIAGEAENGLEAVKKVKVLKPDVTLLDISMPRLNGLEAIPMILEALPNNKIIILSMHKKEAYAHQVLSSGAMGYVLKASPSSDLVKAIKSVCKGEYFLSPGISREVINTYLKSHDQKSDGPGYDLLSEREKQIFRLTVEGNSINQAAEILFLSPKTIERHRANIMKKLEVNNLVEMVKYAVKFRIIDPDLWTK